MTMHFPGNRLHPLLSRNRIPLLLNKFVLHAISALCLLIAARNLPAQNIAASVGDGSFNGTPAANESGARALPQKLSTPAPTPSGDSQSARSVDGAIDSAWLSPAQNQPDGPPASQTKRILAVIPNFRAVNSGQKLPAQTVKEKFITTTEDSFDYSSIFIPAVLAGYSMAEGATPEFHQGAAGYARYFWHAAADQTIENYMVEFVVPVITREDTRYYTMGSGAFLKRTGYALSRAVITRSDSGDRVFNFSEVIGAGASAGLSSLYYPSRERSFANTGTEWGLDIGIDAAAFIAKEFWPDINRAIFHAGNSAGHTEH